MAHIGSIHLFLTLVSLWTAGAYFPVEFPSEFPGLNFEYHDQHELKKYLTEVSLAFPKLTTLYVIGQSHRKNELLVLNISAAPADKLGVPNVKLLANIHGNEPGGREVALHFIQFLVTSYSTNSTVQWLLNNTRIHVLANINPDGFQNSAFSNCTVNENGRKNLREVDLNRNFPDYFRKNTRPKQPETLAIMKWMNETSFVLSASLHSGAVVANYPLENTHEDTQWEAAIKLLNSSEQGEDIWKRVANVTDATRQPSLSPDDDVFKHLATVYASTHPNMHKAIKCPKFEKGFKNGIVNGAEWFPITGSMQDYNYVWHGCMELTFELSCCKYPPSSVLPSLWEENKQALLKYFIQVHYGVEGVVLDYDTHKAIPGAELFIAGRNFSFRTSKRGEFWRILLPGNYTLQVMVKGYENKSVPIMVNAIEDGVTPSMNWLNVSIISTTSPSKGISTDCTTKEPKVVMTLHPTTSTTELNYGTIHTTHNVVKSDKNVSDLPESTNKLRPGIFLNGTSITVHMDEMTPNVEPSTQNTAVKGITFRMKNILPFSLLLLLHELLF